MNIVVQGQTPKYDSVEIQRHGLGWKVCCYMKDVMVNYYYADNEGMAIGIARRQMERVA